MPPIKKLNDEELTAQHIAELENSDRIRDFFYGLGYDVEGATDLPHATVNMDTDDLQQRIRRIRKIANDPDEEIEVILFEVRSVTVALTQTIAQRFRQRGGNYLLVLTSDYEKLDFVLLERIQTEGRSATSLPKYVVRPRILTVNRRRPNIVALRVLKRFTFTEADGLYQWDKLRSAYNLAEWSEPEFNNRALFSDYYLKHRLTDRTLNPTWAEDVHREGDVAKRWISGARSKLSGEPEAKTRAELIEPLLKLLGFEFRVERSDGSVTDKPDYALYLPSKTDKPIALALVYRWNRNLDAVDTQVDEKKTDAQRKKDKLDENPGALVVSLLEKGDVPWVVLTNGKSWRLYSATASNKITNYYEIDLEEALFAPGHDRETAFKYWWLMFRREAFTGFLDKILTESQDYAKQIGERLKDRIFKQIFGYFAGGFIHYMRNQGIEDAEIESRTEEIFHATMTFLYRMMFVLYAESLELVPVKEENGYGTRSLRAMKTEIATIAGKLIDEADGNLDSHYETDSIDLYGRLRALFSSIDKGDPTINLPVYNGGLFSSETSSGAFLDQVAIPDVYLAIGLDRLARDVDDKTHELVFIDFKSLGVRQLGSIYEGLLEFKLRIASEKLAVIKDGKREIYMPNAKAVKEKKNIIDVVKPRQIYIENTKQERKATGSYYTPDYIVKYIVEHTVGPVLDEKFKALEHRLRDAQKRYRQHRDTVKARKDSQSPELFWTLPDMQQLADDCLNLRVLDPAMGSGHFLVEVVDYTSNRLIDFLNAWNENPVWALLEQTRADILSEMERQGVSIDDSKLTRVVLLKRSVLKRCVYGVDLNEMAVELAKVSLWLDAFTLGAPLSFLDHHLKWGNSLIGTTAREADEELQKGKGQQMTFLTGPFVGLLRQAEIMRGVSALYDATIEQTHLSSKMYSEFEQAAKPYKQLLDIFVMRKFDVARADEFLRLYGADVMTSDPQKLGKPYQEVLNRRESLFNEIRFFHWDLEFPEVFIDLEKADWKKDGGFDAVVGNPPWVDVQETHPTINRYQRQTFKSATGKYDQYALFLEVELRLIATKARLAAITPSKFFVTEYGEGIRNVLAQSADLFEIVDLSDTPVFEDAATYPVIMILGRTKNEDEDSSGVIVIQFPRDSRNLTQQPSTIFKGLLTGQVIPPVNRYVVNRSWFRTDAIWRLEHPKETALWKRVFDLSLPFSQHVSAINRSLTTGLNEAYIDYGNKLAPHHIEPTMIKSLVTASDLNRFTFNEPTAHIIFPYEENNDGKLIEIRLEKYPYLKKYFDSIRDKLSKRRWYGKTVVEAGMSWYSFLFVSQNILKPKLMFPKIASSTLFSWDPQGDAILLEPAYVATIDSPTNPLYLLSTLNSRLLSAYILGQSTKLAGGFTELQVRYVETLPIRKIDFTTSADRRTQLAEKGYKLYERCLSEGYACVLEFVTHHLEHDETDVIHDLLAFLAQQMIDLNKQKQAEVKRFLGWLENTLHIAAKPDGSTGLDSLNGKTIIQGYLGDYQKGEPETAFEDFYYRLHQNRGRFGATLSAIQNQIEDEYNKSLDVLRPIKEQLATTDALIDKVVYQLYGLTDEEIKLIEYPQFEQAVTSAREEVLKDKENAADPDKAVDAIAAKIEPAAAQYFARVEPADAEVSLRAVFNAWDALPQKVRTFMLTGEVLLAQTGLPDYSPVVISYAKAAETVINERLFIPFRDAGYTPYDCNNEFFQRFMAGGKPVTLGSMGILLGSRDETTFRTFVTKHYPNAASTIFAKDKLLALLTKAQVDARNGAAHDGVMSMDDANTARQWALEILSYV